DARNPALGLPSGHAKSFRSSACAAVRKHGDPVLYLPKPNTDAGHGLPLLRYGEYAAITISFPPAWMPAMLLVALPSGAIRWTGPPSATNSRLRAVGRSSTTP